MRLFLFAREMRFLLLDLFTRYGRIMIVLSTSHLSFGIGDRDILKDITFSLNEGDRLGIIGVNGAGKTTLFRLLSGEYTPSDGAVFRAADRTLGYLKQDEAVSAREGETLIDFMLSAFPYQKKLEGEIAEAELLIAEAELSGNEAELFRISSRLAAAHEAYAKAGGLAYRSRAHSMLSHLGFPEGEHERLLSTLSGGQHTRLALARLLASEPDILLLDEPTNHLDIDALLWLEEYLAAYPKTVLVISHDRYFLDRVTTRTLMVRYTHAKLYEGAYTRAKQAEALDEASHEKQYKEQQKIIARIEANIAFQRRCGQAHNFVTIRAKQKQLDRMEKIEAIKAPEKEIRFAFQSEESTSQEVIRAEGISFAYAGAAPLIQSLSFLIKKDERVLLLGANGTGKSTLMKILSGKLKESSGKIRFGEQVSVGYYDQETHSFNEEKTVFEELHDEYPKKTNLEIRNALALFLFSGEDVDKPIRTLSGGEKARLTLAKLMLKPVNLLLLDEPTNHLDIGSREALETALIAFSGTVVAVSHDRYFIDRIGTRALVLSPESENGAESYAPYEDETLYAAYLRKKAEVKQVAPVTATVKSEGKEAYEQKKQKEADERAKKRKKERAEKTIPAIEEKIEALKAELFGSAAADYVRAAAIESEISALEEELFALYELVME